jgi:hypothetical protein
VVRLILGGTVIVAALLCTGFVALKTTTHVSAVSSVSNVPLRVICSTTIWTEEQATDDYQQDGNGTYHLQNQLWAQVDAFDTSEYCGSEKAVAQLWVPSGGSISDWCVALSGIGGATSRCSAGGLSGGGPYILQADPLNLACGYAGGGGSNDYDPWALATTTGTYPC